MTIPFPVLEVSNGIAVQPNHVYVVPPDKRASIRNGTFSVGPITSPSRRQPIDEFMRDLAAARGDKAIGVVLSGTGPDGMGGLAAIKAAGGITFAQDPKTAQWPDKPSRAIQAGGAGFILSPAQIALELGHLAPAPHRPRAEETLQESEERFRLMANSAPVMIWMSGPDKLCTWCNDQWLAFVGRTLAQELGNGWAENVHPEDFDGCLQTYTTHFDARKPFSMEYRLRRHDGQWRWILDHGSPRYDSRQNFAGYVGSCADVTSLKLLEEYRGITEQKLRQRDSELRALFDGSPDPHLRFDSNLRVTHANAAYGKLARLSAGEVIGKTGRELPVPQDDVKIADPVIKGVFRTGQPNQLELSVPAAEGIALHEVRYVPEFAPDGSVAAVLAIGRDISEQKRMERALRQRESEFAALFESSPDAYARFDPNLRVTHANTAFEKAMGVSAQAIIGKTIHQLPLSEGNRRIADLLIKKVLRTGQSQQYEFSVVSTGSVTEYEVRYVPELSTDGSVAAVLGVGRDITERKRMEQELRKREREMAALFDNSPDVIVRRDRNSRNLYVNAAWEKLMGIPREMAIGKTSEELGLLQATVRLQKRAIRHVLKTRSPLTIEFTYPSSNGPVDHEVRHIPEFDAGGVSSILSIGRDVTEQKRLQKLAAANERDIRALSASLITAQEQERRRIAREIHDSLCQHLGALAAEIRVIAAELPALSTAGGRLQAAQKRALGIAEEARQIARQLHPAILEDLGLQRALRNLCHEFSHREGIPIEFRVINPLSEAPLEAASCVYRIAQEALNNVVKHAHAKNVWVRLSGTRQPRLSIHDDGIGFDVDSVRGAGGLGLVSMNERARIAGAKLSIRSQTGHGTRVNVVLPIRGATRGQSTHSAGR